MRAVFCVLCIWMCGCLAWAQTPDTLLRKAGQSIKEGNLYAAIAELDQLVERQPNFGLAHWLRYRLYSVVSGKGEISLPDAIAFPLEDEWRVKERLWGLDKAVIPSEVWYLSPKIPFLIVMDVQDNRLIVYRNNDAGLEVVQDYYASIGRNGASKQKEGDNKTPVGIYFFTKFLPANELEDRYGSGAFPINYPNIWDRRHKRTGHGIWLHGTEEAVYSRAPKDSDGCIVLTNNQIVYLRQLLPEVDNDLPIIIGNPIRWRSGIGVYDSADKDHFLQVWQAWQAHVKSRQVERLSDWYWADFKSSQLDRAGWHRLQRKRERTQYFDTNPELLSILQHSEDPLVVVNYSRLVKGKNIMIRQYWEQRGKQWKMVFEGAV